MNIAEDMRGCTFKIFIAKGAQAQWHLDIGKDCVAQCITSKLLGSMIIIIVWMPMWMHILLRG